MKKILTLSTIVAALFLSACAEKKEEVPAGTEAAVEATEEVTKEMAKEAEEVAKKTEEAAKEVTDSH